MANKASTQKLLSIQTSLQSIKSPQKKLSADHLELYEQLVTFTDQAPRELVDGVVGLSVSERKAYVTPYLDLYKSLVKAFNPKSQNYQAPPLGTLRLITKNMEGVLGWLKSRHKYKPNDLNDPASDDELLTLQDYFREATGDKDFYLPMSLIDSMRISDGANVRMLMYFDTWLRLYSTQEIREAHQEMLDRFGPHPERIPISPGVSGNYLVLWRGEVYDLNHEDGTMQPIAPGLYKILAKAHQPQRP